MSLIERYDSSQLRDYSSLFSRNSVQEWIKGDFSSIRVKVKRYDNTWFDNGDASYLDYLKYVYSVLERHYQNEYILKNTFLNEWLIKELGEYNSKLYSEFRVGDAKADLAMFNGSSKVFEIKTEFDSDRRLKMQLENYQMAFNQVFLIIPSAKIGLYERYDKNVGIILFDSNCEQSFAVYREAKIRSEVDSAAIMKILHTREYKEIVQTYFGDLPPMTSFNQFNTCNSLIHQMPNSALNEHFIAQMKKRGSKNALSKRYYREFNQISLAMKMDEHDRRQMLQVLKSKIEE